jgi:hypothetical protein
MARRYARLGDQERAVAALEVSYEERAYITVFAGVEPLFDTLHGNAAFLDLARRVRVRVPLAE